MCIFNWRYHLSFPLNLWFTASDSTNRPTDLVQCCWNKQNGADLLKAIKKSKKNDYAKHIFDINSGKLLTAFGKEAGTCAVKYGPFPRAIRCGRLWRQPWRRNSTTNVNISSVWIDRRVRKKPHGCSVLFSVYNWRENLCQVFTFLLLYIIWHLFPNLLQKAISRTSAFSYAGPIQ